MTPKFSLIATLVVGLMASVANAEVKISGKIGFGVDGGVSKVDTYYANGTHTSTKQDVLPLCLMTLPTFVFGAMKK